MVPLAPDGSTAVARLQLAPLDALGDPVAPVGQEVYRLSGPVGAPAEFTGREWLYEVTAPGTWPTAVTGVRCDGRPLTAGARLTALIARPPEVAWSTTPESGQVAVGQMLIIRLMARNPDGAAKMTVAADDQDTATEHDFAAGELKLERRWTSAGARNLSIDVVDAEGDRTRIVVPVWVADPPSTVADLGLGAALRAGLTWSPGLSVPAAAEWPLVVAAAADQGIVVYRVAEGAAARFAGRWQHGDLADAADVALDSLRNVAFVAGGRAGVFFADLTDPARPRTLWPERYFAAGAPWADYRRVTTCRNGAWVWAHNHGDAVYALELAYPERLDGLRDGSLSDAPGNSPWAPLSRHGATLVLPEGAAEALACFADRWVAAAAPGRLTVYDLQPFFDGTSPRAEPVAALALPGAFEGSQPLPRRLVGVSGGSGILWQLAAGAHGYYEVEFPTTGTPALTVRKHLDVRRVLIDGSLAAHDLILDFHRDGTDLLLVDYAYGVEDALIRLNTAAWPAGVIRRTLSWISGKCASSTLQAPELGNNFSDVSDCKAGVRTRALLGVGAGRLWGGGSGRVESYEFPSKLLTVGGALPDSLVAADLDAQALRLWGSEHAYAIAAGTMAGASSANLPPPLAAVTLPVLPVLLATAANAPDLLVADGARWAWLRRDVDGVPAPVTWMAESGGVSGLAMLADGSGAVVRLTDGRMRAWALNGSELVSIGALADEDWAEPGACGQGVLLARTPPSTARWELLFWRPGQSPQPITGAPRERLQAAVCAGGSLWTVTAAQGAEFALLERTALTAAGALAGTPVRLPLRFPQGRQPDALALRGGGGAVALHFGGRGFGTYVFADGGDAAPRYIGGVPNDGLATPVPLALHATGGGVNSLFTTDGRQPQGRVRWLRFGN